MNWTRMEIKYAQYNISPRSQCRLRQRDPTERGHQETEQALPERHSCQARLQRIQTDEASESQKREYILPVLMRDSSS